MEKEITGVMVYYYYVCKRKLWYFYNGISMEQENDDVQIGKALDENSYQKEDKHININNIINIDFIKAKKILHEVKKSKKIEDASIMQVKYYLYFLKEMGVDGIKGKIDYPLLKQSVDIELSTEDEALIRKILIDIKDISNEDLPPKAEKKIFCKKCAYYDLCYV